MATFVWAPDSVRVLVRTVIQSPEEKGPVEFTTTDAVYGVASRTSVPFKGGDRLSIWDWFPDGMSFAATVWPHDTELGATPRLARVPVAGGPPEYLTPGRGVAHGREGVPGRHPDAVHRA